MPASRRTHRRGALRPAVLAAFALLAALLLAPALARAADAPLKADVTFDSSVVDAHLHGRVYLLVRPGTDADPLDDIDVQGSTMIFGKDVDDVGPNDTVSLSGGGDGFKGVYGFPAKSLDELPAGTYTVRAFFNVYETAHRSDGSTVDVHFPCGDGGWLWASPGNLQSAMRTVSIDRKHATDLALTLDDKLTPARPVPPGGTCQQDNLTDSAHVKHIKIKSEALSAFWGRPMYVAADVLLPWDYDDAANATTRYPVVYLQDHYSTRNPFGFSETSTSGFSGWWKAPGSPKMIVVQFRTENPFYDDSYVVNSANVGPYGDAINDEMIPHLDSLFRTVAQPYARALTGGSTGGWISVANMIYRPDLFGSAWAGYPDSLDFNAHQAVDLYNGDNAFFKDDGSVIPSWHDYDTSTGVDTVTVTMPQENQYELATGNRTRSLVGQWDIWNAVFGAQGANCYPLEPWNKVTGAIDHRAVDMWKPFDMSEVLTDHWATLGPILRDKLHIWVGTQDTYYLNEGVKRFQHTVEALSGSDDYATFTYGEGAPHGYTPYASTQAMLTDIARFMTAHTPAVGAPQPDLAAARGNLWSDVSANSCATKSPAHPTISGDTTVGQKLTANPGTWDSGMNLTYQWQRGGTPIDGATGTSYVSTSADAGTSVTVSVTGAKLGYDTTTQTSDAVTIHAPAPTTTVSTPPTPYTPPTPSVSGTAKVGLVLTAKAGTWATGYALSYQWLRGGQDIAGATTGTYRLVAADRGAPITVRVSGRLAGGPTLTTVSAATRKVTAGTLAKTRKPHVSGTATVGRTLKAVAGGWSTGVRLTYRWYRSGRAIARATHATYTVTAGDRGKRLTVQVTGRKTGYAMVTRTSRGTRVVR